MLIRMMTFNGKELREGMGAEHMAKFMGDMAKANPNATLDDLKQTVLVAWPASIKTGTVTIERAGQPDEVIQVSPLRKKPVLLQLPSAALVRLAPSDPDYPGARFISSPNAEIFKQLPGADGPAPALIEPAAGKGGTLEQVYTNWLATGDVGSSSKALSHALCYDLNPSSIWTDANDSSAHPHDWSDFGRCVKMLDAIPQLRDNLCVMEWISPAWALIYNSFDRLEALYRADEKDRPDFTGAVLEGVPPRAERIASIGASAIKAHFLADGRAHNVEVDNDEVKSANAALEKEIRLHRGATQFEPMTIFARPGKKAGP